MTQLSLSDGLRLQAEGLEVIERTDQQWVESMRHTAMRISLLKGAVSSDDLRVVADQSGNQPVHQNSWGAVFRGKCWKEIGRKKSEIPGNHCREIRVWRYET